ARPVRPPHPLPRHHPRPHPGPSAA
ncbi:MAG: hypothetical protein AVDCRST_MAG59-5379, partial [uncultured Thermomicrobiales bacterium]